jgi:hypothetical protein
MPTRFERVAPPETVDRVEGIDPSDCFWCGAGDHATAACDRDPPGGCSICGDDGHRWAACARSREPGEAERQLDPTIR